ncbi:MAG: HD domain-containing protein [Lachnospiraceae bacterium]|nr:HD domain-containing protein [Lachnospiraceae bacterium]
METSGTNKASSEIHNVSIYIIVLLAGILLNIIPATIVTATGCPLWLDTTGTILAAAIGGYIPGIIVGFITNAIKGLSDITSFYYATLNIMISACATFLVSKGWFKKIHTIILSALFLAVIGSGIGGLLPWFLEGFPSNGLLNDIIIDFFDKLISVSVVVIILKFVPAKIRQSALFRFWMQRPLNEEDEKKVKKIKCRSTPIRSKVIFILICSLIILAVAATIISFVLFRNATILEYSGIANDVGHLAGKAIDPEMVDAYINEGTNAPGYLETKERLEDIKAASHDVKYLYAYKIMEDGCHVVFDLDSEDVEASAPGDLIDFDESFEPYIPKLLAGEDIEPIISNEEYGWLLTEYTPLKDSKGNCVCYIGTDVEMSTLFTSQVTFVVQMIFLFAGIVILITAVAVWLVDYCLVYPVNSITLRAGNMHFSTSDRAKEGVQAIKDLDIHTGDEIEKLYTTILAMTQKSAGYLDEIRDQNATLSKMQSSFIMILADMVENRDENTGAHIRKTASYVRIILKKMRELGIHEDILTDEYIENVVSSAPLHDIGKIQVPDAVLNKPGRLNDMEYEVMKTHTTAGKAIIDQLIHQVPRCAYLQEARDMAHFHHEKWDGNGYPEHLKGEDIPLSARVMAVADVFDALVSKRIYKPPMSLEKAFSIIREGSGTHFDPDVVNAFFAAEEEVKQVEEQYHR